MVRKSRTGASDMSWQRWMQRRGEVDAKGRWRCRKDATIGSHSTANHDLCIEQIRLQCPARKV